MMRALLKRRADAAWVLAGQIMTALGGFVGVRLMTEALPPDTFGGYKLALSILSLVSGFMLRPVLQYAMRAYHDESRSEARFAFVGRIRAAFGLYAASIALAGGIFLLLVTSQVHYTRVEGALVGLLLLVQALTGFERSIAVTQARQARAGALSVAQSWLVPAGVIAAFAFRDDLTSVLAGNVGVLWVIYLVARRFGNEEPTRSETRLAGQPIVGVTERHLKGALAYGGPLALVGVFSWVVHESDRLFLAYYHSEAAVGIYSAAYGIIAAPFTMIVGMGTQFLYPIVFGVAGEKDEQKQASLHKAMLSLSVTLGGTGVLVVWTFPNELAWLALGPEYRDSAIPLLPWLALGYGFMGIAMAFDLFAYAAKNTWHLLIAYISAAAVNISLNVALIPDQGAKGAVIATASALLVYLVAMVFLHHVSRQRNKPQLKGTEEAAV